MYYYAFKVLGPLSYFNETSRRFPVISAIIIKFANTKDNVNLISYSRFHSRKGRRALNATEASNKVALKRDVF